MGPGVTSALEESWLGLAREDQMAPYAAQTLWLMLGGRGSGKTFAGAGWVLDRAWEGGRIALIGPSLHDVREVMIEGPSGVMQLSPPGDRPRWEGSRRRLVWQGGAMAYALSAEDPESLRGPQFHAAWADELCAWREPQRVLDTLRFGLRLGRRPRLAVTTTPRPIPALRRLMTAPGTAVTRMATAANAANLSPGFLDHLTALYGGTRLAAQELEGLVTEGEGALFRAEDLSRARAAFTGEAPDRFERVVVAVDPPITTGGDACGIVAAGRLEERAYVLADRSVRGLTPGGWAARAAETARAFGADRVLAESNQGGEMVSAVLKQAGCPVRVELVHASRAKRARAEPVAMLYEQGRIVHCGAFAELEEELMALGSEEGTKHSPDRADALVWAVTDLMLRERSKGPRISVV
jgi:phage terminase large subunit-like protein